MRKIYLIIIMMVAFFSCTTPSGVVVKGVPSEQNPVSPTAKETALVLDDVSRSVGKVTSVAFYYTWELEKDLQLKPSGITDSLLKSLPGKPTLSTQSVSGTAWVGYKDQNLLGFVTAAHVVVFKDTLYTFFSSEQKALSSVSIKIRQKNYITEIANSGEAVVAAYDTKRDIAILKKEVDHDRERPPLLNLTPIMVKNLTWAMPLYILGYPRGNLLLTKAVATKPSGHNKDFFANDAVFNRGMSGAPVIAVTSEPPWFYLAGIVSSASMEQINYLEPALNESDKGVKGVNYYGTPVINSANLIKYGMTKSVTMNSFISFVKNYKNRLLSSGFSTDFFLHE